VKAALASLINGLVFSVGLAISGMTLPAKVTAFLDVTGRWDPSLAFVIGFGLVVVFAARRLAPKRPVLASSFAAENERPIDRRLISGAVVFGIGWGLAGFCPGPAVVSIGAGTVSALCFVPGMMAGMALYRWLLRPAPAQDDAIAGVTNGCG
jgi:uncharacterized membrane protein YedE/YeeE